MFDDRNAFFIDNEWAAPCSNKVFDIVNASTGEKVAATPQAEKGDVDAAVAAARRAFDKGDWSRADPKERAGVMMAFMSAIADRGQDLAAAVSTQNGMPISVSAALEGKFAAGVLQYYAGVASEMTGPETRPSQAGKETLVARPAIGVVAAITPWNFPVTLALSKIAPAMAAGCAVVIKPSPGTVLDSYILAEAALEAGVPPGVLNWIAADREVGAYLVSHPGVDKVAFTGSTAAGRKIAQKCGELLRPVTLELGGKSAAIVLDDADLSAFAQSIPMTSMLNNGQACYNGTRIIAPAAIYDDVVDAVSGVISSLVVGDALSEETHIGPMASSAHRDRVEGYIAKGKEEAKLVAGGGRPKGMSKGWFVEPTLFADVDNDDVIAREEIFGPVLSIIACRDEDDAVTIANDSEYGLGGSVWSADHARALSVAERVETGTIGVNGYMPSLGAPFGGVKASGIGREFGPETVAAYQSLKSIYVMG